MDLNQLAGHMLHIGLAIWLDLIKVEKLHFILGTYKPITLKRELRK